MEETTNPTTEPVETPAGEQNTETTTPAESVEQTVPYSRFAEINRKLRDMEQAQAAREAADAEAKRKDDEANQRFQQLYEEAQAALAKERSEREQERTTALRNRIAAKHKLPELVAARLQGTTEEELEADAQALAAALPKPDAPTIDSSTKDRTTQGVPDKAFRDMTYAEKEKLFDADPELFRKLSAQG